MTIAAVQLTPAHWLQVLASYRALPGQQAGALQLQKAINQADPSLLVDNAEWLTSYRNNPPPGTAPWQAPEHTRNNVTLPLPVPYLHQQAMDDGQGYRDCFSTTGAMLAEYLGKEPKGVAGENAYNHIRATYGDTTTSQAQLAALRHLGLDAHYGTDGSPATLRHLLDSGHPVGLGLLHHGSTSHPTGGHWVLAIGYTADAVVCHDPFGELDLVAGTWARQGSGGEGVHYSWHNLMPRWCPGGSDGWYLWAAVGAA